MQSKGAFTFLGFLARVAFWSRLIVVPLGHPIMPLMGALMTQTLFIP